MAYEQRDGSGILFKNDRKQPGSKQPDYRGEAKIDGREFEIAGWIKEARNGKKFLSLSVKPADSTDQRASSSSDADDY